MEKQGLIKFMQQHHLESQCPKLMSILVETDEISFGADMQAQEHGLMPLLHINVTPSIFYRIRLGREGFLEMATIMQAAVDDARSEIEEEYRV